MSPKLQKIVILREVDQKGKTAYQIANKLKIDQSTVLDVLEKCRRAGLVNRSILITRRGKQRQLAYKRVMKQLTLFQI